MKQTASQVEASLCSLAKKEKAEFFPNFFRAFPGGYGEGDKFIGVVVPDQRRVAKKFRELPRDQLSRLLQSLWHECRLTGLFILVDRFERSEDRRDWCDFYLEHLDSVNNWDLVDSSAAQILGRMSLKHKHYRKRVEKLAASGQLWRERVAMIATLAHIREADFALTLQLAERFLVHSHDLMHKAAGWMLREVGKRDRAVLSGFLDQHAAVMPRTMLRYAIEKYSPQLRKHYLSAKQRGFSSP